MNDLPPINIKQEAENIMVFSQSDLDDDHIEHIIFSQMLGPVSCTYKNEECKKFFNQIGIHISAISSYAKNNVLVKLRHKKGKSNE